MRFLQRLRHHADLAHDVIVVQPRSVQPRRLDVPGRAVGRDLPGVALVLDHVLGPALANDVEVLFEGGAVRGVDLVVLTGPRTVDAVNLLREGVDPAALIAARKAGQRASARHMVEHRDVLGDANRVMRGQHDAELADADALGLHRQVEVEHDRVGRELETLNVEVVLGEADRVVTERVAGLGERTEVGQHVLVQLGPQPGHPLLNVLARPHRGEEEEGNLHDALLVCSWSARASAVCRCRVTPAYRGSPALRG